MKKKQPAGQPGGTAPVTTSVTGKKKIVIVDDDPSIRDIFKIIFARAGYDAEIIDNGDTILKNKYSFPQLFLIDKQLSGYDGLDLCRHLKASAKTRQIPVIMISASPDISRLAPSAGADAYIEKPFEISYLLEMVSRYTGNDG